MRHALIFIFKRHNFTGVDNNFTRPNDLLAIILANACIIIAIAEPHYAPYYYYVGVTLVDLIQ